MDLKPGTRWKSAVCEAEFVVVKPPKGDVSLECGGRPLIPYAQVRAEGGSVDPAHADGCQTGKRFSDGESGIEVLCTKTGAGSLSVNGVALGATQAKKLPSSD